MSSTNSDKECHFILLPVSHIICGKPHLSIYEVTFIFNEKDHGNGSIEVLSMSEIDEFGNYYDAIYIMEEGPKDLDTTIINCIYYNQDFWDVKEDWWNGKSNS